MKRNWGKKSHWTVSFNCLQNVVNFLYYNIIPTSSGCESWLEDVKDPKHLLAEGLLPLQTSLIQLCYQ